MAIIAFLAGFLCGWFASIYLLWRLGDELDRLEATFPPPLPLKFVMPPPTLRRKS